jgi:hypothetical protein
VCAPRTNIYILNYLPWIPKEDYACGQDFTLVALRDKHTISDKISELSQTIRLLGSYFANRPNVIYSGPPTLRV